jgi:sugar phosphate isomerase/epimerase
MNWNQIRRALDEVGYDGFLTPELKSGNKAYLTNLS